MAHPDLKYAQCRFDLYPQTHLRLIVLAIRKVNRHFTELVAKSQCEIGDLYLKDIAIGADTIQVNALWIIGTVATLAVLVIGGLFFFGHSRAQDYAARIAIGAVIIVSAPGIAA